MKPIEKVNKGALQKNQQKNQQKNPANRIGKKKEEDFIESKFTNSLINSPYLKPFEKLLMKINE